MGALPTPALASVLQPACLCHLFKLPFSLIFSVSPQFCVPLSVYILPCHSESLFVIYSLPFCNSACVSFFSFCPCACLSLSSSAFLSQSRSVGLSFFIFPCASLPASFPSSLTFSLPLSLNPSSSTSSPSLSVSPPVPTTTSPQPEPRWAPGLLWAPPFSIPRRGGNWGGTEVGLLLGEGAGQEGGGGRSGPVGVKAQGRGIRAPLMTLHSLLPPPSLPETPGSSDSSPDTYLLCDLGPMTSQI